MLRVGGSEEKTTLLRFRMQDAVASGFSKSVYCRPLRLGVGAPRREELKKWPRGHNWVYRDLAGQFCPDTSKAPGLGNVRKNIDASIRAGKAAE